MSGIMIHIHYKNKKYEEGLRNKAVLYCKGKNPYGITKFYYVKDYEYKFPYIIAKKPKQVFHRDKCNIGYEPIKADSSKYFQKQIFLKNAFVSA